MTDLASRPNAATHAAAAAFLTRHRATFAAGVGTGPNDTGNGVMVAVTVPADVTATIARPDGTAPEDLHVTVATFSFDAGTAPDGAQEAVAAALTALGTSEGPMTCTFTHGDWLGPDLASWTLIGDECLQLRDSQAELVAALADSPAPVQNTYAYLPHLTLGDYPDGDPARSELTPGPLPEPVTFQAAALTLHWGADSTDYPMTGPSIDDDEQDETDGAPAAGDTAPPPPPAGDTAPPLTASTDLDFVDGPAPAAGDAGPPPAGSDDPSVAEPTGQPEPPAPAASVGPITAGGGPRWVSDIIVPYNVLSGDKRRIAAPNGLRTRPLPLPLAATFEIAPGHDGAGFAGNITEVDNRPTATGKLPAGMGAKGDHDLQTSYGVESERLMRTGRMNGVSIDLGDVTIELSGWDEMNDPFGFDAIMDVVDGEIMGTTHVMHPAFTAAAYRSDDAAVVAAGGKPRPGHAVVWPLTAAGAPDRAQDPYLAVVGPDGRTEAMGRRIGRTTFKVDRMSMSFGQRPTLVIDPPEPVRGRGIAAAGAPALIGRARPEPGTDDYLAAPPAAWFTPLPNVKHAIRRTPEGEMFGLVARWSDCHTAFADRCLPPPRTHNNYRNYNAGALTCAYGTQVYVGPIFADTVHPILALAANDAYAHYHDTGCLLAQGTVGENEHGIWFHGAAMPELTPRQVRYAGSGRFSGDWRPLPETDWQAELISVLAVNGPGYATPSDGGLVAAGGEPNVLLDGDRLVAAVGLGLVTPDDPCGADLSIDQLSAHPVVLALIDQLGTLSAAVEVLTAKVSDSEARERLLRAQAAAARLVR